MQGLEIREAHPMDAGAFISLAKYWQKEAAIPYPPINDLDTLRWYTDTIAQGGSFVATFEGRIIGTLGLSINQFQWNRQSRFITNEWLFVHPKFRKTGAAKYLLKAAKTLSGESGLPFIFTLASGTDRRVARFFTINGFKSAGDVLTYGL